MPDSTVDILIKTRAELQGAESAAKALEVQIGKAKALGKDYAELQKQLDRVNAAIKQFNSNPPNQHASVFQSLNAQLQNLIPGLSKVQGIIVSLGSGTLGMISAGVAGIGSAFVFAGKCIKEFIPVENEFAKLDSALARTNQLSDSYRETLAEMAGELQKLTGRDDDEWISVLTKLTQFGATSDNIQQSVDAVKNLAGILDGDLQSAAMMVSKALQGNYDMFSRYGIKVAETGTQTQRLNQLFEQLALRGGGQLEAQMKTLSGQTTTWINNVKDIAKGIGSWIVSTGILQNIIGAFSIVAETWAEKLGGIPPKLDGLRNAMQKTTSATREQAAASAKLATELERINAAAERTQQRLAAQASARDKILAAEKKLELAELDERAKKTHMSDTDKTKEQITIERKYLGYETANKISDLERRRQSLLYVITTQDSRIKDLEKRVNQDKADQEYDKKKAKPRAALAGDLESQITAQEQTVSGDSFTTSPGPVSLLARALFPGAAEEDDAKYFAALDRLIALRTQKSRLKTLPQKTSPDAAKNLEEYEKQKTEFRANYTNNIGPELEDIALGLKTESQIGFLNDLAILTEYQTKIPDDVLQQDDAKQKQTERRDRQQSNQRFWMRQLWRNYYSQGPLPPSSSDRDFFTQSEPTSQHPEWFGGASKKAQEAANAARAGVQSIEETLSIVIDTTRQLKTVADEAKAAISQIREQRNNGRGQ